MTYGSLCYLASIGTVPWQFMNIGPNLNILGQRFAYKHISIDKAIV